MKKDKKRLDALRIERLKIKRRIENPEPITSKRGKLLARFDPLTKEGTMPPRFCTLPSVHKELESLLNGHDQIIVDFDEEGSLRGWTNIVFGTTPYTPIALVPHDADKPHTGSFASIRQWSPR